MNTKLSNTNEIVRYHWGICWLEKEMYQGEFYRIETEIEEKQKLKYEKKNQKELPCLSLSYTF